MRFNDDSSSDVPRDADAEALMLGACMRRQSLIRSLGLTPDLFWTPGARRVWLAMAALSARNPAAPFTYMDVYDELDRRGSRRSRDDASWIDLAGSPEQAATLLADLRMCAERRRRIDLAHRLVDEAYSPAPLRPWKDSAGKAAPQGAKGAAFDV